MFMEVDDKVKIAYYWFSKEEKDDKELRESLRPEYRQWNQKGYKVVNFLSGTEDLIQNTTELLLHNRDVMAENELANEVKTWNDKLVQMAELFLPYIILTS